MTDIFRHETHAAHFNEFGYVVLDAGLTNESDEIEAFINPFLSGLSSDFYYSLIANDLAANKAIRQKIRGKLQGFYDDFLRDYKSLNESFLSKPANTVNELLLHQDWCYTREEKFSSLTLWMPLCDVDKNNGALFVLPGSHKWFNNLRSCSFSTARISSKEMPTGKLKSIDMRKGQVLLFHPAVFHGSHPNNTNRHRAVVTSVVLSKDANYLYFQSSKVSADNNVTVFSLDEDAYLRELKSMAVGADPSTGVLEQFNYHHPEITAAQLFAKAQA